MSRRVTFKDPLIRVRVSRVIFPKLCPVCGREANHTNKVVITPKKTQYLSLGPMTPYDRRRMGIPSPEVKTFHVYACEDHSLDDGGIMRLRAISAFYALLALCMLVFAFIFIGSDIHLGRPVTIWTGLFFVFVGAVMTLAYVAFRPYGLEAAFRVIGFDYDFQHVWLQLQNPAYRNAMIERNAMDAELVSWIVRGRY
ncbi:MAG: hypothetical protein ACW98J_09595 [Candidatus Thorarchaeota archaeon]|jgi:hypothetical protein